MWHNKSIMLHENMYGHLLDEIGLEYGQQSDVHRMT